MTDQYVAFLRGINVGGHTNVRMADLKKTFEQMGFLQVHTVLASGNVVFESGEHNQQVLTRQIETMIQSSWKKDIGVILRRMVDLRDIRSSEPFKGIRVTSDVRLYVTFLAQRGGSRSITLPFSASHHEYTILHATSGEVFSVVDLSAGKGTPDLMNTLTREYGREITTRNWNTVLKVLQYSTVSD